jgi:subtilase family serine protease
VVGVSEAQAASGGSTNAVRACAVSHQPAVSECLALIRTDVTQRSAAAVGFGPTGYGYGPSQLASAYKLPSSTAVRKVAVVDAYNDPNAVSDFNNYRSSWGLPACNTTTKAGCLTVVNQNGKTSPLPTNAGNTGWATEESLDVDMVAAICPSCHVFLVEANDQSDTDLGTAVNSAISVNHAKFVSNSYGGGEFPGESSYDSAYYKHKGIVVTVSAGDSDYGVSYPAASRYVTAVGGTSLVTAANARGWSESVWNNFPGQGTGSGCSSFEAKPHWQHDTGCSYRTDNDVAADADPETGVAVYDTYDQGGWLEVGGTSASSPMVAAMYALAGNPVANTWPSKYIYQHSTDFFDVTSGNDGSCSPAYLCTAGPGYDGPTGLGTPDGVAGLTGP